jgi:site-specific DNA recombinase
MTRAALYLRISQDSTGQHLGVDRQREDCLELAKQLDWEVAETYTDNDRSAYKVRPEYERMLTNIDAGNIDAIVAGTPTASTASSPTSADSSTYARPTTPRSPPSRCRTIDLTTPTGRLVAGMMAQVATYEGEAKADRWRRSWRQGREAGRWVSGQTRTFGYTREGQVVEERPPSPARWPPASPTENPSSASPAGSTRQASEAPADPSSPPPPSRRT